MSSNNNFKTIDMKWIKRILGITELINKQEEANKLIGELIVLQKQHINNMCEAPSNRLKSR